MGLVATYVDADTFTVVGDRTADFVVNRKVRCDCGVDGYKYGVVSASAFGATTSVDLTANSDNLTANLTDVDWSVVKTGAAGNIPLHSHIDEDTGGTSVFSAVPVNIVQANALNIQTDKVRARDGDGLYLVDDGDNGLFIEDGGNVFLGDTANAEMTQGLTINQGASDNEILALKSSDVAHGCTSVAETDTFMFLQKVEAAAGGLWMCGLKDADGGNYGSLSFLGLLGENVDTTKTSAGRALIEIQGGQISGTATDDVVADGNVLNVMCKRSGAWDTLFIVDEDGDLFADGGVGSTNMVTLYDEYDDAHLVRAFDLARSRGQGIIKSEFDSFLKYNEDTLVELGILGAPVKDGGLTNVTRLQQLLCGTVWQLYTRLEEALRRLTLAESQLKLLEV